VDIDHIADNGGELVDEVIDYLIFVAEGLTFRSVPSFVVYVLDSVSAHIQDETVFIYMYIFFDIQIYNIFILLVFLLLLLLLLLLEITRERERERERE